MTKNEAQAIAGKLTETSKMPCYSYGLPTSHCKVGATLMKIPGSVCHGCYANKGRYIFAAVQRAQFKRLFSLKHPQWCQAMATLLKRQAWFRWHDSGDLQGVWHLHRICEVARLCPQTRFWLPTREKKMLADFTEEIPPNLTIRLSATMVDGPAPIASLPTSTVVTKKASCPAYKQNNECGKCRRCWSPRVKNVSYRYH